MGAPQSTANKPPEIRISREEADRSLREALNAARNLGNLEGGNILKNLRHALTVSKSLERISPDISRDTKENTIPAMCEEHLNKLRRDGDYGRPPSTLLQDYRKFDNDLQTIEREGMLALTEVRGKIAEDIALMQAMLREDAKPKPVERAPLTEVESAVPSHKHLSLSHQLIAIFATTGTAALGALLLFYDVIQPAQSSFMWSDNVGVSLLFGIGTIAAVALNLPDLWREWRRGGKAGYGAA